MLNSYEDIINLPRHISIKHSKMTLEQRAAQFAPFSALTGYDEAVKETARLTDREIEINEELRYIINEKLKVIIQNVKLRPLVTIVYFVKDDFKEGGKYLIENGIIKKVDVYNQVVIMESERKILIKNIIDVKGEIIDKKYYLNEYMNKAATI